MTLKLPHKFCAFMILFLTTSNLLTAQEETTSNTNLQQKEEINQNTDSLILTLESIEIIQNSTATPNIAIDNTATSGKGLMNFVSDYYHFDGFRWISMPGREWKLLG